MMEPGRKMETSTVMTGLALQDTEGEGNLLSSSSLSKPNANYTGRIDPGPSASI